MSTFGSEMKQQVGALRCLASTDWGNEKSTYIATGRSTVEYAAVAWLPWVSLSTMEKQEMCQRYAGRAITGQVKTIPAEAILVEVDIQTVVIMATQLSAVAMEKSYQMPDTNPRRQIAATKVRQHTKKTSQRGLEIYLWVHVTRKDSRVSTTLATN